MAGSLQLAVPEIYGRIYLITNRINGKRYVGQTKHSIETRWKEHVYGAKRTKGRQYISRAILKYGPESFEVRAVAEAPDPDTLDRFEDFYIRLLDTMNPEKGYNLRHGGDSGRMSDLTRQRMSEARKNIKIDISGDKNPFFGKKHTPETIAKLRAYERTKEHRENISLAKKGAGSATYRHDVPTEKLIELYAQGIGTWSIAKMVGMDKVSVWNRLKSAGVEIRKTGWKRTQSAETRQKISKTLRARNGG